MAGLNAMSVASRVVPAAAAVATTITTSQAVQAAALGSAAKAGAFVPWLTGATVLALQMGSLGVFVGALARTLEGLLAGRRTPEDHKKTVEDAMNERFPTAKGSDNPEVRYVYEGVAEIHQRMLELEAKDHRIIDQAGLHSMFDTAAQTTAAIGTMTLLGASATFLSVWAASMYEALFANANHPTTKYYGKRSSKAQYASYVHVFSGPLTIGVLFAALPHGNLLMAAIFAGIARCASALFLKSSTGVTYDHKPYETALEEGLRLLARFEARLVNSDDLVKEYEKIKQTLDAAKWKD